jgi:hypothetical protein
LQTSMDGGRALVPNVLTAHGAQTSPNVRNAKKQLSPKSIESNVLSMIIFLPSKEMLIVPISEDIAAFHL